LACLTMLFVSDKYALKNMNWFCITTCGLTGLSGLLILLQHGHPIFLDYSIRNLTQLTRTIDDKHLKPNSRTLTSLVE
jgi:hypothetical protein